jgi:hypothetical protein
MEIGAGGELVQIGKSAEKPQELSQFTEEVNN